MLQRSSQFCFAEGDEWASLQEGLEATQKKVKASMQSHREQHLVILVSLGGWIRGTQVVSGVVEKITTSASA